MMATLSLIHISAVEAVGEKDAQGYFEYLALLYKRFRIAKDNFLQRPFLSLIHI